MRRLVLILAILIGTGFASWGVGYAFTSSYKQIVGIGNATFNREVDVTIHVSGPSKVTATLESTTTTTPDYVYTVTLYLDLVAVSPTQTVSFTFAEIPGTKKKVTFTGLSLGSVSEIGAEVTR